MMTQTVDLKYLDPKQVKLVDEMCADADKTTVIFFAPLSGKLQEQRLRRMERLVQVLLKSDEATFEQIMTAIDYKFGVHPDDPNGY